jgi:hypothetical protein
MDVNSKKIIPASTDFGFTDMMDMEEEHVIGVHDSVEAQLAAAVYIQMENLIDAMISLEEWRNMLNTRPE